MLPTAALAAPEHVTVAPAATIDAAEGLLGDFEAIMVQLDERSRSDLCVELERLTRIAESHDARETAVDWPRETGENRFSTVNRRAHVRAHRDIMPKYGELIAAAVAARKAHGSNWSAAEAAEAEVAQAYAAPKAADIERYGDEGDWAWRIAWAIAMFHGFCDECEHDREVI